MAEGTVAADQLRLFIERIERLEEEKKGISDDVRDVYAEAKANGYDPKIMRMVVRLRKMETHTRQEQDAILETHRQALGLAGPMLFPGVGRGLGRAAHNRRNDWTPAFAGEQKGNRW